MAERKVIRDEIGTLVLKDHNLWSVWSANNANILKAPGRFVDSSTGGRTFAGEETCSLFCLHDQCADNTATAQLL